MSERRKHPRVDTLIMYDVRGEGKGWSEGYVNLSAGGLRFKTDRGYSLGARVDIDITHHLCSSNPLRTAGRVVRSRETHGVYQVAYEVAIEFEGLGDQARRDLRRIVSNLGSAGAL
jgi:hypothetical protein